MVLYFNFVLFKGILLTLAFTKGTFEILPHNFGLIWTHLKFQNFRFSNGKCKKVNIAVI